MHEPEIIVYETAIRGLSARICFWLIPYIAAQSTRMKLTTPVRYLRIGMPLSMILASAMSQDIFTGFFAHAKWLDLLRLVFFLTLNFELGRWVVLKIQQRIPGIDRAAWRFVISYLAGVLISFVVISLSTIWSRQQIHKPVSFGAESLINFTQCIWLAILIVVPTEVLYSYRLLFAAQKEKAAIEKQNLENQLQNLQEMVSPHFLFNTLNTLSSLVTKDAGKAENYIQALSELYRQMLVNNRKETITLQEELLFAHSYLHLVRERYLDGFDTRFEIQDDDLTCSVVPLTLQILFENAIKHNIVSSRQPLVITVASHGGVLTVSNNLQPKQTAGLSSGIGLYALDSRYRLLDQAAVRIEKNEQRFSVHVPLLNCR